MRLRPHLPFCTSGQLAIDLLAMAFAYGIGLDFARLPRQGSQLER